MKETLRTAALALHTEMDRAVLAAHGCDIPTACELWPDHEGTDEDDGGSGRKTRYRYRWSNHVRDEVLARLLELNVRRADEQKRGE